MFSYTAGIPFLLMSRRILILRRYNVKQKLHMYRRSYTNSFLYAWEYKEQIIQTESWRPELNRVIPLTAEDFHPLPNSSNWRSEKFFGIRQNLSFKKGVGTAGGHIYGCENFSQWPFCHTSISSNDIFH